MKKFIGLFLIASFLFIGKSFGQKIKNERAKASYTRLPSKPLSADFTTYSVVVYGSESGIERLGLSREGIAKSYFQLGGYKRLGQGGHFRISVNVSYPRLIDAKNVSYTKKIKKDDKEKTVTRWKRNVKYICPVSYKVEDYQGNILVSGNQNNESSFTFGDGSVSSSSLSEKWRNNRHEEMSKRYKSEIKNTLSDFGDNVKRLYAYTPMKDNVDIEVLRKKDKGADGFFKAAEVAKSAYANMKSDEKLDEIKEQFRPAIEFWQTEKNKWSAKDKKEKKVRSVCLYNLATTFYYLDEFEEAEKWRNELVELDHRPKRIKYITRGIESTKKLYQATGLTTRHVYFDLSNATSPSSAAFGALEQIEEDPSAAAKGFVTDATGKKLEGEFTVTLEENEDLKFGEKGNVKFSAVIDGRPSDYAIDPAKIKDFMIKDRKFIIMNFTPGAKGNTESKMAIMEQLYDGAAIKVFKYYPYNDQLGDQAIEYAFQKTGEEAPTSTNSTMFLLFNKGLQKYFADCPDLGEAAGSGEFKKNEDDIVRAARVYAEMCKTP